MMTNTVLNQIFFVVLSMNILTNVGFSQSFQNVEDFQVFECGSVEDNQINVLVQFEEQQSTNGIDEPSGIDSIFTINSVFVDLIITDLELELLAGVESDVDTIAGAFISKDILNEAVDNSVLNTPLSGPINETTFVFTDTTQIFNGESVAGQYFFGAQSSPVTSILTPISLIMKFSVEECV